MSPRKSWLKVLGLGLAALCAAAAARAQDDEPARAPRPGGGAATGRLVSGNAELVVFVDVRKMLDSPLVKKYFPEQMKAGLKQDPQVQEVLKASGLDPLKDIDSVTVIIKEASTDDKWLGIARGQFDLDKIEKAASDFAEKNKVKLKISKEDDAQLYEFESNNKPGYAAFADKNTLVVSPSREYTLEGVKNSVKGAGRPSKELQAALGKVSGRETVWWAGLITEERKKQLKRNPQTTELAGKLQSVTGSLDVSDELNLDVQIHTSDAKSANQIKTQLTQLKPILGLFAQNNEEVAPLAQDLIEHIQITSAGNTARVKLTVTKELIEKGVELFEKATKQQKGKKVKDQDQESDPDR